MNDLDTNHKQKENIKLSIEIINKDSDDSMNDNDFQTARYISLNNNLLSGEKIKKNNNNYIKKNTKMSSGVEDIEDTVNENDNNNSINIHIQAPENKKNYNLDENNNENNYSCDNLIITHHKKKKIFI